MTQPLFLLRKQATSLLRDYAELVKLRVTTLIVMTAWCGYYFGAQKAGVSSMSWGLVHALLGIGLVSSGTAALNEVMEHKVDARMRRTAQRPLPAGRMSLRHATTAGLLATVGGSVYLAVSTNPLTGLLTLLTSVVYLAAYTPLKRISPICTFVGAFPGAMPGVLGWTAARGHLEWGTLILFAILFVWQFPHFFSIAWLYREDYASGGRRWTIHGAPHRGVFPDSDSSQRFAQCFRHGGQNLSGWRCHSGRGAFLLWCSARISQNAG